MRLSKFVCALIVVLAAFALTSVGASAEPTTIKSGTSNSSEVGAKPPVTVNNTKSNTYRLDPNDPNAPKPAPAQYRDGLDTNQDPAFRTSNTGGTAAPAPAPVGVINLNSSRSNVYRTINPSDPNAVQACTSGGGKVGKGPNGQDACITNGTAGIAVSDPGAPNK